MSSITTPPPAGPPDDPTAELPPLAEDVIATPAVEGDLHAEMRRAAKPFTRSTVVLAALFVLAIAFAGGAWTHAAFGSTATSSGSNRQAAQGGAGGTQAGQRQGTAGQGQGQGQGGGFRGRGTAGTIDHIDGTTVYVKTAQGDVITVSTSDSTTVGVTQPAKLSDLKPGATVTVQGQTGSDGTVSAQSITQQAAR